MQPEHRLRRRLIDFGQRAITRAWLTVFGLARLRWRSRATVWPPPPDIHPRPEHGLETPSIMVVAPHPDDECAGCAGTLLHHGARGDTVTVVTVTDGRASRALGLPAHEMAHARRAEAEAACAVLGTQLHWCGLREGEWQHDDGVAALTTAFESHTPSVVYAPSRFDFHPEHRATAHALATALAALPTDLPQPTIRIYPVQVPLDVSVVNRVVPVGDWTDTIERAFAAHRTQRGSLTSSLRRRRYAARLHALDGMAEEHWQLSADAYARLHSRPEGTATFHGLRYLALLDGILYWRNHVAFRREMAAHG